MTQRSGSLPPQFPWMDEKPSKQQEFVPPVQTKPRNTPREELGEQQQELPPVLLSNLASSLPHCIDSLVSAQAQSALLDSELSRNRYTSRSPLMKFDEKAQTYKLSIRTDHYPEVDTRLPEIFMKDEGALALENRFPGILCRIWNPGTDSKNDGNTTWFLVEPKEPEDTQNCQVLENCRLAFECLHHWIQLIVKSRPRNMMTLYDYLRNSPQTSGITRSRSRSPTRDQNQCRSRYQRRSSAYSPNYHPTKTLSGSASPNLGRRYARRCSISSPAQIRGPRLSPEGICCGTDKDNQTENAESLKKEAKADFEDQKSEQTNNFDLVRGAIKIIKADLKEQLMKDIREGVVLPLLHNLLNPAGRLAPHRDPIKFCIQIKGKMSQA